MKGKTMNTINRSAVIPFAILAMWATNGASSALAEQSAQPAFASAAEASQNLFQAVQSNNEQAIIKILGGPTELASSRDDDQDKVDREMFVQKYQEMHRLGREADGSVSLYIGAENWPFPIPLVSRNGRWHFDADGGADEVRFRRIGENEVTAIGICHALLTAETHPGKNSEADGLVKTVLPHVQDANKPIPFHGYYFRILSSSNDGFAAIAYPATYRSSGVMTFIVNHDDAVYEKDLGPNSAKAAGKVTSYHSDPTWTPAESTPP